MSVIHLETEISVPKESIFDLARSIDAHHVQIVDYVFMEGYMRRFLQTRNAILKQIAESVDWKKYPKPPTGWQS